MTSIIRNIEGWLCYGILNIVFGFFNGLFGLIGAAFDWVMPLMADLLMINPFGSTVFSYSTGALNGTIINLTAASDFVETLSQALQFLGIELALLFGIYGMLKASASLVEMKRIEHIFVHFLKFGIVIWAISNIYDIIQTFFDIFLAANSLLLDGAGFTTTTAITSPGFTIGDVAVATGSDGLKVLNVAATAQGASIGFSIGMAMFPTLCLVLIILLIIVLVSCIKVVTSVFDIAKEMIARIIRFYLHLVLAPVVLPLGLTEGTKNHLRNYFTSLAGVALEWVLSVELLLIIGKLFKVLPPILINIFTELVAHALNTASLFDEAAMTVIGVVLIPSLTIGVYSLLLNIMKSLMGKLDTIAKGMLALGGI